MISDRMEMRRQIENWFELHKNEMLDDLARFIAVKSVLSPAEEGAPYGAGSRECLTLARSMLEERGFQVSEFENMIITADLGAAPAKMGILCHLDVVAGGEGWATDPFEMVIKDGKIYGRGATDDKGPSIAAMYAMYCAKDLCPELRHGFQLLLGSGEESGCEDIAQYLEKNNPPPNVFTPDADYPVVNVEKGRIMPHFAASWESELTLPRIVSVTGGTTINVVPNRAEAVVEGFSLEETEGYCQEYSKKTGAAITAAQNGKQIIITTKGTATHAAMPHLGTNAQTALIEMLAAMPFAQSKGFGYVQALNRLFPHGDYLGRAFGIAMSDEISGDLTLSFGVVRLSENELSGNFDSRTPACADDIDLAGMVNAAFERAGIAVTRSTASRCHHTPEDSPFVQTLLRIYEEYTGNPRSCLAIGGQTYVHGIQGGVTFGCLMPGSSNNIHGANEFISIDDLLVSAMMFAQAIIETCA